MKEHLRTIVAQYTDPERRKNVVREYLQAQVLASLQNDGAMRFLAFHGRTALRFLHQLPRFSEDLDFTLETSGPEYSFTNVLRSVKRDLIRQGYSVRIKINDRKTVNIAYIKFDQLLFDFGLSNHTDEFLSIKIEIDTAPPAGTVLDTSIVRRYVLLHLQHHDRASLFAGKLHSILARPWVKGRDFYDLVWYLSDHDWPQPNLLMLNRALAQTGWGGAPVTDSTWRTAVLDRITSLDLRECAADVRPFLENAREIDLLTQENLTRLLLRE